MEIHKKSLIKIIILVTLVTVGEKTACAVTQKLDTPASVKTFYSGMVEFSKVVDKSLAGDIHMKMLHCFCMADHGGISISNDFRYFSYDNSASHSHLMHGADHYISKLEQFIFADKVMSVEYDFGETYYSGSAVDFTGRGFKDLYTRCNTIVRKTYIINDDTIDFTDTVVTIVRTGLIYSIKNGKENLVDAPELINRAQYAYLKKNYAEAYRLYKKAAEKDVSGEAYYRLGIMTFLRRGCKEQYPNNKDARKAGIRYVRLSNYANKPDNLVFFMEHYNR